MGEVVAISSREEIGDGLVLSADDLLAANRGVFSELVLCGVTHDGEFVVASTHGTRDAMWSIRRADHFLVGLQAD